MAAVTAPAGGRRWLAGAAAWAARQAAAATVKARTWHLHAAAPGIAGSALVSAGLGLKFGLWAGLIVAGGFLLRLDGRL